MSDRGFLFIFSVLMVFAGAGAAVWLLVSGQAATVDGLFLLLTAGLWALCFALYAGSMVRRAMAAGTPAPTASQPAKAGAGAGAAGSPAGTAKPTAVPQQS
jgi:hypothetical protein